LDLLNEPVFWLTSVQRFLFILAIALPFDVRDLNRDKAFDVITAAGSLGLNRLKRLCHLLLSAMLLVVLAGILMNLYQPAPATGMLISVLGTGWLINKLELNNSEFYFTVLLDGTLIDQLFWVWLMGLMA
jgi:4-hydroxybenzoate polyprenyltransferase